MNPITRRQALKQASITGLLFGVGGSAFARASEGQDREFVDRDFVLAAGMTEEEADCWGKANAFAGAFLGLVSNEEGHEQIHLIHVFQEKLLMRPTYRRYLEAAGGGDRTFPSDDSLDEFTYPIDHEPAVASGLTDEEVECWTSMTEFATAFDALPKMHPVADHEVAHALHSLRAALLARPTLRGYDPREDS